MQQPKFYLLWRLSGVSWMTSSFHDDDLKSMMESVFGKILCPDDIFMSLLLLYLFGAVISVPWIISNSNEAKKKC